MMTGHTRLSFTSRGLLAVASAAIGIGLLMALVGSSLGELSWWVEHRMSVTARLLMGSVWGAGGTGGEQFEALFASVVRLTATFFPALTGLEILAGLGIATGIYHRVALRPQGRPLERFRAFRFSEHLGWAMVIPLVVVVVPKLAAAKAAAANILLVTATLYVLRGAAVAASGLHLVGGGGLFLWVLVAVATLLMLPVVLAGAILLGVLDAGLDFRRRWSTPSAGK